jgi:beta-lactamase class A
MGAAAADCVGYHPLQRDDAGLHAALESALATAGLGDDVAQSRLAVAVVDLTRAQTRYAGFNDDVMFYAASLPKILSLLAMADAAETGRIAWSDTVASRLSNMINRSSNADASWAFERVGLDALQEVVTRPGYCFYGRENGGLWLGRAFRPGGPTRRDPSFHISHGATARQVARFYVLMDRDLFDGDATNRRVKAAMGPPALRHKFVGALADRPVTITARKSGTWRHHHADSALIEHGSRRYALVALAHSSRGSEMLRSVARLVDDVMMDR